MNLPATYNLINEHRVATTGAVVYLRLEGSILNLFRSDGADFRVKVGNTDLSYGAGRNRGPLSHIFG